MTKTLFMLSLLGIVFLLPVQGMAYNWQPIGPSNIETYNFEIVGGGILYEIICEENGIMIFENNEWQEYSYGGLPVWDVEMIISATADLIVVMGDGTDSDGIYGFNFSNYEFYLLQWLLNPRFIEFCSADTCFYAGGEEGLFRSQDGLNWQSVTYFENLSCCDMESYDDNYVVAATDNIHYSIDAGSSWNASNSYLPVCDLTVSILGNFYGIFPDQSYSSGLWSSCDQGCNWEVEFWSINMSCVEFDVFGYLFTGWEIVQSTQHGVACWQTDIQDLYFMNDGLPCLNINKLTFHPLIDCNNIIACTDMGLYMATDYFTSSEPDQISGSGLNAANYPNPFNPQTTIFFNLAKAAETEVKIFDAKGRMINVLYSGFLSAGNNSLIWSGKDYMDRYVASGIYIYQIKTGSVIDKNKMLLIK